MVDHSLVADRARPVVAHEAHLPGKLAVVHDIRGRGSHPQHYNSASTGKGFKIISELTNILISPFSTLHKHNSLLFRISCSRWIRA